MSFSVELWNGYSIIYKNFIQRRKGLKFFIYMLTEKFETDVEYAKNMKKIYDLNFEITSEGTLYNGIQAFKNDILHQYEIMDNYVNKLKSKIIEPLKNFLFEQQSLGKKLNSEKIKIDKDFEEAIDRLEKVFIQFII